jgi:hypothetical protein
MAQLVFVADSRDNSRADSRDGSSKSSLAVLSLAGYRPIHQPTCATAERLWGVALGDFSEAV